MKTLTDKQTFSYEALSTLTDNEHYRVGEELEVVGGNIVDSIKVLPDRVSEEELSGIEPGSKEYRRRYAWLIRKRTTTLRAHPVDSHMPRNVAAVKIANVRANMFELEPIAFNED